MKSKPSRKKEPKYLLVDALPESSSREIMDLLSSGEDSDVASARELTRRAKPGKETYEYIIVNPSK